MIIRFEGLKNDSSASFRTVFLAGIQAVNQLSFVLPTL
jgi:hypothetical protein